VVPICVPELEQVRVAQILTISSEMAQAYKWAMADPELRRLFNTETRLSLTVAAKFSATDYLQVGRPLPSCMYPDGVWKRSLGRGCSKQILCIIARPDYAWRILLAACRC
jgi:hypothetical protein